MNPCPKITGKALEGLKKLRDEKAFFGPDGGLWTESGPLEIDVSESIGILLSALEWHQLNKHNLEDELFKANCAISIAASLSTTSCPPNKTCGEESPSAIFCNRCRTAWAKSGL